MKTTPTVDMTSANDEKLFSLLAKGEPSNSVIEKNILKDRGTLAAFERLTGLRIGGTTVSQKRADVREAFKAVSSSTETLKAAQNAIESGTTATEGHKNAAVIIDQAIQANRAENSRLRNSEKVKSAETKAAIDATNRQHRFLETVRNYVINGGDLSGFTESPVANVSGEGGTNSSETKTTRETAKKRVKADFSAYQDEITATEYNKAVKGSAAEQYTYFSNEEKKLNSDIKNIAESEAMTAEEKAEAIEKKNEEKNRLYALAKSTENVREMMRVKYAGNVDRLVEELQPKLKKYGIKIDVVDNIDAAGKSSSGAYFDRNTNTIKVSRNWDNFNNVVKLVLAGEGLAVTDRASVSFDRAVTQTIAHEIAHADSGLTLDFIKAVAGTQYDAFDLKGRLEHPDDRSWRSEDAQKEKNWRRYVDAYTEQAMLEMKGTEEQRRTSAEKVVNDAYIFEEIMADMFGAAVDDMGHSSRAGENIFWAMNRNKPGIIKRILNALERFIARIRGKDAYLAVEQRQAAERLRDMLTGEFKRAYGTDVKGEAAVESDGGKRHSIVYLDDGKTYVTASRNVISGNDVNQWRKQITNFFNALLEGNKSIDIETVEGDTLTITKKETARKARDNFKQENGKPVRMSDNEFRVKLNVEAHIDEIAETARSSKNTGSADTKSHAFAKDGFTYRTAYFEDFNGDYYRVRLSIGNNGTVATVYNVGKMIKDVPASAKILAVVGSKPLAVTSSDNSISQDSRNVNRQFSEISDAKMIEETAERLNEVSKPEKRFSLSSNVEQTKDLIAVHNMTAAELEKSLDLGGLPMPSIAIIKAADGHSEYGDVSLVFGKDTIDPKKSARNKVYGGDAWTPTFPKIDYKANEKVGKRIRDKYYDLSRKYGYDNTRALYNYAQDLSDVLTSEGGEKAMIDKLYGDTGMMQIYLMDTGKGRVANVNKETKTALTDGQVRQYEILIDILGRDKMDGYAKKPGDNFDDLTARRRAFVKENEAGIRKAFEKTFVENGMSAKDAAEVSAELALTDLKKYVLGAYSYTKNGTETVKTEFDSEATDAAIKKAADGEGYRKWINNLFGGAEEKSGIRNSKDAYTASGNRRSFEALHWENNLENIVKAMLEQDDAGKAYDPREGMWGVSMKKYNSISEIKNDSSRLRIMNEAEYNALKEQYGARMQEIAQTLIDPKNDNYFIASDDAYSLIVDAVRNSKDESGILRYLKKYNSRATEKTASDIAALVRDIAEMPTGYFEAKPQRAVGFDEVKAVILPDNASGELISRLESDGINTVTYKAGDENSRLEALNGVENVRFSLARANDEYMKAVESGNVEEQQRLVDEAAENAGYDTVLYHGTQSFGFTQIDVSKYSDDGISFFATSNPEMAQTYSAKSGTREISRKSGIENLSLPQVVDRLNAVAAADTSDYDRYTYRIMNRSDTEALKKSIQSGIKELRAETERLISEYADRLAKDFNGEDELKHSRLRSLLNALDSDSASKLSANLYTVLNHNEIFDDAAKVKFGNLEADIRLLKKLAALKTDEDVVVHENTDRYDIVVEDQEKARKRLEKLDNSGNYVLRGRTEGFLEIDGNGHNWNDIFTTLEPKGGNTLKAEYDFGSESLKLSDRDGEFAVIPAKSVADAVFPMARAFARRYGTTFATTVLAQTKDQLKNSATAEVKIKSTGKTNTRDIANFAKEQGYPGVKITDIYDNGGRGSEAGRGDVYIFFNPEQDVKSADPITYDNDGNVIPLSERFNSKNNDIRYSLTRANNEYMKAVESGDTEEQRRLVDEAAKANGYDRLFWHGSKKGGGFTEFRDWSYFTENKKYASRYAKAGDKGSLYEVYANLGNTFDTRKPECREIFDKMRSEYGLSKVQESGLPDWTDGYDIAEFIDENGLDYDSIILDEGGDLVDGKPVSRGFSYVIRSSEQVKSADPITYDDSGNVIPLTERFDSGNRDIRWSLVGTNKDGIEVYETSDDIKNLTNKERMKRFEEIMKNDYRGRTAKFIRNGHAYYATFEDTDINKNIYGDRQSSAGGWKAKIRAGADGDIFELVENAEYDRSSAEQGKSNSAHKGINFWDYYVKTVQIDNEVYDLLANVRRSGDDSYVYNIRLYQNKKIKASPPIGIQTNSVKSGAQRSNNSVSQSNPIVNTQSMQTSGNNSISEPHSLVKSAQSETETIEAEDKAIKNVLEKFSKERYYKSGYPYKFNEFLNRIADLSETSGERIPREQLLDTVKRLFQYAYENRLDGKALGRDYRHDTDILAAMVGDIENEIYDWVSPLRDEYNEARDVKKKLRTEKIFVPTEIRASVAEAAGFETWSDFRKSLFGIVGLVNEQKGRALSEVYAELSEIYPEYFPDNITDGTEQTVLIADLARNMRVNGIGESNALSYEEQLVKKSIGRVISELLYNGENTVSINALRKRIAQLKKQREKAITSLKEKYAEQFKNRSEKQKQTVLRNKVLRKYTEASSKLYRPTTENHFTEAMRKPLMEFLAAVDITTGKSVAKQVVYDRILKVISDAQREAAGIESNSGLKIEETDLNVQEKQLIVDSGLLERMSEWVEANKGKKLTELSSAQLEELNGIFNQLNHLTAEIKRLYDPREGLAAKSWQAQKEIGLAKNRDRKTRVLTGFDTLRKGLEWVHYGSIDAYGFFNGIDSDVMDEQLRTFRRCQDKFGANIELLSSLMTDAVGKAGIPEGWHGKKAKEITLNLSTGTLRATPSQLMTVYLLLNQEDSRRCLFNKDGGLVIGKFKARADVQTKENRTRNWSLFRTVSVFNEQSKKLVLNEADANKIIESLTDAQIACADRISAILNGEAARLGNEVSMAMYGYKKYTTKNYFPMRTVDDYRAIENNPNNEMTLLGLSFTHERTRLAGKALVAEDIFDVVGRHLTNMAQYNAFAQELDDAKKMYTLRLGNGTSLKQALIRQYGNQADKFYRNLINNLSGTEIYASQGVGAFSEKLLSNYKAAAVAKNISVVLKQPMSIFRALPEFSSAGIKAWNSFKDLSPSQVKAEMNEMLEHSGVAKLKSWGASENMTRKSFEELYNNEPKNFLVKINDAMDSGAEFADMWTWSRLWRMSKAEIDAQNKYTKGSKEYFEAVNSKFSEVIGKTQVVQSALDSSMAVQNAGTASKFLYAFQNEPLKQYSYLTSAINDAVRGKPGAKAKLAKVIASSLANTVAVSAITTLVSLWRGTLDRDDDDELWDDILKSFSENALKDILSGGLAPVWQLVETVWTAVESGAFGKTVERMDLAALTDLGGLINKYLISQNGGRPNLGMLQDIVNAASNLFGWSAKNVMRDLKAGLDRIIFDSGLISPMTQYNYLKWWKDVELTNKAAVTEAYYDVLRDAVDRGRYSDYVKIKRDMIYHGYTETKIKNAVMKSSLMDDLYELKKVNPGSYKAKVNSIVSSVSAVSSLEGKEFEDFIESAMKRREREDGGSKTDDEVYDEMHRKMEKEVKEQLIYIDVSKRAAYIKKMLKTYGEYGITEADILKVLRKAGKA